MFVVTVRFDVKPDKMTDFLPAMRENATASLNDEPGCLQFDVCANEAPSTSIFLYEIYTDEEAFKAHLQTTHFMAFDAKVADWIDGKDIATFTKVWQ